MKIDQETIDKIAHLARLTLQPEEKEPMAQNLEAVLNWMDQLNEVDTENVKPLTHMTQELNVFREDVSKTTITREQGLSNAPNADKVYFNVPKVKKK